MDINPKVANPPVYKFPDRDIEDSVEWKALRNVLGLDDYGYTGQDNPYRNEEGGYDDGTLRIVPYYWGDDETKFHHEDNPNFWDRQIGLKIWWYKYPFRGATMNWEMTAAGLKRYFGGLAVRYMAERIRHE